MNKSVNRKKSQQRNKDLSVVYDAFEKAYGERSTDATAASIYNAYRTESRPFALFLRDFQQESYDYHKPPTEVDPQERRFGLIKSKTNPIESKLVNALEGRLPLLAIWNHSDLMYAGSIPRLKLPDDRWLEFLENMVNGASLIVMDCHVLSPGVRIELETIIRLQRQDSAVILLPREAGDDIAVKIFRAMGTTIPDDPMPEKNTPELQSFPRVAYEDEVPYESLDTSPLFADLLDNAARLANGDLTVLPAVEQIRILNRRARDFADSNRIEEALQASLGAMQLAGSLEDRSYVANSLMNAGIVYLKLGFPDEAAEAFYRSGALFEELNDSMGQGQTAAWLAMAYENMGEPEHALDILEASLPLLRAGNDKTELIDALNVLVRLSSDIGRPKKARQYQAELRKLTKEKPLHAPGQ
jgi:tetratricopeptide (TPR) repeat protein